VPYCALSCLFPDQSALSPDQSATAQRLVPLCRQAPTVESSPTVGACRQTMMALSCLFPIQSVLSPDQSTTAQRLLPLCRQAPTVGSSPTVGACRQTMMALSCIFPDQSVLSPDQSPTAQRLVPLCRQAPTVGSSPAVGAYGGKGHTIVPSCAIMPAGTYGGIITRTMMDSRASFRTKVPPPDHSTLLFHYAGRHLRWDHHPP